MTTDVESGAELFVQLVSEERLLYRDGRETGIARIEAGEDCDTSHHAIDLQNGRCTCPRYQYAHLGEGTGCRHLVALRLYHESPSCATEHVEETNRVDDEDLGEPQGTELQTTRS